MPSAVDMPNGEVKHGKRKHQQADDTDTVANGIAVDTKSSKKRKSEKSNDRIKADPVEDGSNATAEVKKEKKKKSKSKHDVETLFTAPEAAVNGSESRTETKEERRARKAAKREAKKQSKISESTNGVSQPTSESDDQSSSYVEESKLAALPASEIADYLKTNMITTTDPIKADYRPIIGFQHLPRGGVETGQVMKKFDKPTPIQAAAWPFALAGRDIIGIAETGSGKTLAFGLPCVRSVLESLAVSKTSPRVRAVVVSPTRELALQINAQMEALAEVNGLKCTCVYGGVPKDSQRAALSKANILIATPGRLNDFIQEGAADLSQVGYVVLDEADRMLDKGFEDDIRKIVSQVPRSTCQTLMFTATWPESIRKLAATFMRDPVKIAIGDNPTGDLRANTSIEQIVEVIDPRDKQQRLLQLLKQHQSGSKKNDRILVFCLYKKEATRIEMFIRSRGFSVTGIHGDLSQPQRTENLDAFKSGNVPILVATDVAARGLDIPSVKVVINNTFPLTVEDYVHRIGRTGRAGAKGIAHTLFTDQEKGLAGALVNVLKAAKQPVPEDLAKFGGTVKKKAHDVYGAFYKDDMAGQTATKISFD